MKTFAKGFCKFIFNLIIRYKKYNYLFTRQQISCTTQQLKHKQQITVKRLRQPQKQKQQHIEMKVTQTRKPSKDPLTMIYEPSRVCQWYTQNCIAMRIWVKRNVFLVP